MKRSIGDSGTRGGHWPAPTGGGRRRHLNLRFVSSSQQRCVFTEFLSDLGAVLLTFAVDRAELSGG